MRLRERFDGPFTGIFNKQSIIILCLLFVCIFESLLIIKNYHLLRVNNNKLQNMHVKEDRIKLEKTKLILELSTWQSRDLVYRVAKNQLRLVPIEKREIIR